MGFKQHISRTWQMIEQQVNDVPFRPDNEVVRQIKPVKSRISAIESQKLRPICDRIKRTRSKELLDIRSSFFKIKVDICIANVPHRLYTQ